MQRRRNRHGTEEKGEAYKEQIEAMEAKAEAEAEAEQAEAETKEE